eukprot:jgi/Tetstr1/425218/TSEL_015679.t1
MQLTAHKEDMATTELAPNLLKGKYVMGVVTCKDCMRPRCMYSLTHPRNMEPTATAVDGKKVQPNVTEKAECKQYSLQNFQAAGVGVGARLDMDVDVRQVSRRGGIGRPSAHSASTCL